MQEEDAKPWERAAAHGGVPGCPQAGRVGGGGSIFALPSGPRGAGRRGSAVQAFSPEAKTLAQGHSFARACKIREGSPGSRRPLRGGQEEDAESGLLCSGPRRLSWLSSSWTSRRIEEKGGTLEAPPFWFGTILGAASPKDLKNESSPFSAESGGGATPAAPPGPRAQAPAGGPD